MNQVLERAARVRLVVFDVDGVLTDGQLYLSAEGEEFKAFFSRDGHGMKLLMAAGVAVAVISGRRSEAVARRMASLGVENVYQGREDKLPVFEALRDGLGLPADETCYVGDDVLDLPPMSRAGLAVAVADAHPLVVERAHWRTPSPGGRGAVREVCDLILYAQGKLDPAHEKYLL